jgi:MFS family permease
MPPQSTPPIAAKAALRRSLEASTLDGVFATVFSNITGGVLLSNFLIELHANPTEIGLLASIPMVANLLQPLGAIVGDRQQSRHYYCLWIYAPARLIWLILVGWIAFAHWHSVAPSTLVHWTLAIVCVTHFVGAFGSAAWLSWLAALVPRRLRGRYFGIRNSAASLTSLLSIPLLGFAISAYPGGYVQGFGVMLLFGVIVGLISIGFQAFMLDVNPQAQQAVVASKAEPVLPERASPETSIAPPGEPISELPNSTPGLLTGVFQDRNFLLFLIYLSSWMFAVNLSAPFFNLYLLDNLAIDLSAVTLYNSLQAGANLLMLLWWGRLADRIGNRTILLTVGILVGLTPLLWLGASANSVSIWIWLPFLHLLAGGTWAAIDLCNNNLQLGVAPLRNQSSYFAIAAALAGVSGALGATVGGWLAELHGYGGIPGLFVLSAIVRLLALLPLVVVHERPGQSLRQMMQTLFPAKAANSALLDSPPS